MPPLARRNAGGMSPTLNSLTRVLFVALTAGFLQFGLTMGPSSMAPAAHAKGKSTGNLIANSSAEKTAGKPSDFAPPAGLKGWKTQGNFTARRYEGAVADPQAYGTFLAKNSPGPGSRGRNSFVGDY